MRDLSDKDAIKGGLFAIIQQPAALLVVAIHRKTVATTSGWGADGNSFKGIGAGGRRSNSIGG